MLNRWSSPRWNGSMVQQQETAGADRKYSAGRSRRALLCANQGERQSGVTQTNRPLANPERFIPFSICGWLASLHLGDDLVIDNRLDFLENAPGLKSVDDTVIHEGLDCDVPVLVHDPRVNHKRAQCR
jgi:hypothetical protein